TIQETIEIHVQTYGIKSLEMKRDLKLALINYDYDSEMLQREYFQEQPNNYQIGVAKCLSTAKVEENEISLVPYITSQHSATWRISKYLNELLRPFVDKILSTTTFRDEPDFTYQLYDHIFTKHKLQSTTLFCAIKITNYYTLDTHKNMIDTVGYFLEDNLVTNKLEQATIQNIKNLLHIFLYDNVFYYKDQIYTLAKGCPNTMPLSD
ncbi:unnamed protein product, partial [Rotaria magnacalcarata]